MKNKLLIICLLGLLVFSTIDLTLAAKVKCPTCRGAGEIDCTKCDGTGYIGEQETVECSDCSGTGQIKPDISSSTMSADTSGSTTNVHATYTNHEEVEITATVTASLDDNSVTSEEITFPPGEAVPVELSIPYTTYYTGATLISHVEVTVNADEITCPNCNGEGTVTQGTTCTKCDGTGILECPDCGGSGYVTEGAVISTTKDGGLDMTIVASISAVVVVAAAVGGGGFFLLKKRRVNERSLRRLSNGDFQQWVLKRLDGKPATSKDIAMGIDGFSRLNQPISIKPSDSVGMNAIDLFAASLAKNRSTGGIMVAFGFSDDAVRGKVRARTNYRLNIEMMTVRELIESKRSPY